MLASPLRTSLPLALLLVFTLCFHSATALSYSYDPDASSTPPARFTILTPASPRAIITPPPSLSSPSSSSHSSLLSSIDSVSGCARDVANSTRDCNFTSILTITGTDFTSAIAFDIAYQVRCNLSARAVRSATRIVTPVCPYYYPQDSLFDIRVQSNDTSISTLTGGVSFHGTAPYISSISTSCAIGPYRSCDPASGTNTLTVIGSGFLPAPAPVVQLYIWLLGNQFMPCTTVSLTSTRFVCWLPPFSWRGDPPSPARQFGVVAAVMDANWLRELVQSNYVPSVISFSSSTADSSSSSTGGLPPDSPPIIQRVSGCEDTLVATRNCPWPWTGPIPLRLIGSRFQPFLDSLSVWVNDQPCPIIEPVTNRAYLDCSWDTNAVNWTAVGTTPMTVSLNSSAGWVNVSSAVSLNTAFANPSIESVTGCPIAAYEQPRTAGCDASRTLTIHGEAFARYLSPTLTIARSTTVDCLYPLANPLTIECPLRNAVLSGVARNVYVLVQLHLGDRASDAMPYVSFGPDVGPPTDSSSGGDGGNSGDGVSADELVGMKVALLVLSVLALVAIVVALAVWVTGWWLAHRRSYVSQYGQAAVDARQVLLQ